MNAGLVVVVDKAKQIQNRTFKSFGSIAALVGLLGFIPSYYKAANAGVLWSVSHDAPHTENAFLIPHFVCMIFWLFGAFVQLATGGTGYKRVHRYSGYIAVSGLVVGMIGAGGNIFKYDFVAQGVAGIGAGIYTVILILGATVNCLVGVGRAIQRRTAEHKDHMLMAIMWSLDPAVHRFFMWCIRWCSSDVDPDLLLTAGKLPANLFLVMCFGTMIVLSERVNILNVLNVGTQYCLYAYGMLGLFTYFQLTPVLRGCVIAGLVTMTLAVIFLGIISRVRRVPPAQQLSQEAASQQADCRSCGATS